MGAHHSHHLLVFCFLFAPKEDLKASRSGAWGDYMLTLRLKGQEGGCIPPTLYYNSCLPLGTDQPMYTTIKTDICCNVYHCWCCPCGCCMWCWPKWTVFYVVLAKMEAAVAWIVVCILCVE